MAKPIPNIDLRNLSRIDEVKPKEENSLYDEAFNKISKYNSRDLIFGTFCGWTTGVGVARVGKIAAFGLGGGVILLHCATELGYLNVNWERIREGIARSSKTNQTIAPVEEEIQPPVPESNPVINTPSIKPPENKQEEPQPFLEKPTFIPPKLVPHSPKISPSSIPNPSPSVTTTKQVEQGYPNYGGYMYSVPGYSAFQPVSYPGMVVSANPPSGMAVPTNNNTESNNAEYLQYSIPPSTKDTSQVLKENEKTENIVADRTSQNSLPKPASDMEQQFTPEFIPVVSVNESSTKVQTTESRMSVTSLAQGSGAVVTIPSHSVSKEIKKKPLERFSLKTSIPISKIDMKCVNNQSENHFQNNLPKKPFNPAFHTPIIKENLPKIEIQSNIVIKSASKETEKMDIAISPNAPSNSISTLINAAEAINKNDCQFKSPEPKSDKCTEVSDQFISPKPTVTNCPIFNPINIDTNKSNFPPKPPDPSYHEQKNPILFIQNKNPAKMLLAVQPQSPQVLLQRSNFDSKNMQAPSRQTNQTKKCKEELVNENGASSKVVSLKRMHQDNCDENDFENLITENQIYGNKIVVKEKSQGTQQEQDLKNKSKCDKTNQAESKNVVLQPNFVYLSNVQFPANLMMLKNNPKLNTDTNKIKIVPSENKQNDVSLANDLKISTNKTQNVLVSKEINVLKTNNNVIPTQPNKNNKADVVFQAPNQKVIMNPKIVYQVPMIVDSDNKVNQTFVKEIRDSKIIGQNKIEFQKPFEQSKVNDKLYIACPYQMDSKLQPKIVITNIRPKIAKIEEISSIDIYEQRQRMRRLKYLANRDPKPVNTDDTPKSEVKKVLDSTKNIITSENMHEEIYKELASTKLKVDEENNENDSDYAEDDLDIYNSIIEEYGNLKAKDEAKENEYKQAKFLAHFKLASKDDFKEKDMERQERIIHRDAVASAYIAAGRIDCLMRQENPPEKINKNDSVLKTLNINVIEKEQGGIDQQRKRSFLSSLNLTKTSEKYKEDYEKVWEEVERERERRNSASDPTELSKQWLLQKKIVELDPNGQLLILTEIKKHVNENNNLIKKRLDASCDDGDAIKILAEKNFSELSRLSKMADRSVKHFSGQDTKKRDLNPGFDSENIQTKPGKYYPEINIPNISKIISLRTTQTTSTATSTQATSMDEPENSAAGASETILCISEKVKDFTCQVDAASSWTGIEGIVKTYKDYEIARRREVVDINKRNTLLRVESAHITRSASRDSDRAKALLAERRNLVKEERIVRKYITWLNSVVDLVKNYQDKLS